MAYTVAENGLLTLIRDISGYDTSNTSIGDWRILASGIKKAVILNPGSVIQRDLHGAPRRVRTLWVVHIELWIPFRTDLSQINSDIRTERQNILDKIDQYPTLNGSANMINAMITSHDEPNIFDPMRGEGNRYWSQAFNCEVEERVSVTIAE